MTKQSCKTLALIGNQADALLNFRGSLIRDVTARGHEVVALAPDFDSASRAAVEALGAKAYDFPLARTGLSPWQDIKSLMVLRRLLIKIRPDVSLSFFVKPVIYGTLAAAWAGVPHRVALIEGLGYSFTYSGLHLGPKRRALQALVSVFYRQALAFAHQVLMLNYDDVHEFIQRGLVAQEKTQCIGGIGVDLVEWPCMPLPMLSEQPITFALAARLLKEKGVLEYVAAARVVKARHPNTRFLLLGGLDENPGAISRTEVQAWVDEGVVEWPGFVTIKPWLAQSHVYVLPSYREGVPRSTQEALALGRAVITSDAPGCRETVVEGNNGFLVPVRDVPALMEAMLRFVDNPSLIFTMGHVSRQLAEDRFDARQSNEKIIRALDL